MDYKDLDVWKTSMALSVDIYKAFADCRDYGFKDQITRSGLSVPSNIPEGLKRLSDKETVQFLSIARGSAAKLETQILIGREIDSIADVTSTQWLEAIGAVQRMLTDLIRRYKNLNLSTINDQRSTINDQRSTKKETGMKNALLAASLLLALPVLAQTISPNIENITPDSRYIVNNDGTVNDNKTGLMWMQCSEGQAWESNSGAGNCIGTATTHTWGAALALANDKTFAGHTDWRLPDIKELASLVAANRYDPAINSTIFPATPSYHFWSGSPKAEHGSGAWNVYFKSGSVDYFFGGFRMEDVNHVRLVRSP
jgi:four helix bundle protein